MSCNTNSKGESDGRQVFVLGAVWDEYSSISFPCDLQAQPEWRKVPSSEDLRKVIHVVLKERNKKPDPEGNSLSHL